MHFPSETPLLSMLLAVCSRNVMQTLMLLSFVGVGLGYSILNSLICIYYNVIIALALYYLFRSLTASLPWASCDNNWNTDACGDLVWFNTSGQLLLLLKQTFVSYF